jgi:hypothetical protein
MIKLQIQTHSLCITCNNELQIQTHSLCITCNNELQIERKKACNYNDPRTILAITNDKTIKRFSTIQPIQTIRIVFLFIDQLLLTTESKQLDISYMSTHPQEPIVSHHSHLAT